MDETGARINIPPPSMMKNDISVAGDKDSVAKAVAQVKKIWGEMVRALLLLSFECLVYSFHSPSPPLLLTSYFSFLCSSPLLFSLSSLLLLSLLPSSSLSPLSFSFPFSSPLLSLFSFSFLLSLAEENMLHCVCRGAQKPAQVHYRSPRTRTAGDTPDHRLAKHQHYLYSHHVCICLQ